MTTNPYVGPRAFEEKESGLFFGRDEESKILVGLVMARRAALFFAQSGAGKSSLLRAGLIPELTRKEEIGRGRRARTYQKMRVLPILTVGGAIPGQVSQPIANIYVFGALLSLLPDADPDELAGMTLSAGLAPFFTISGDGETDAVPPRLATLLIFDQFEELFTRHPTRRPEREEFFRQVSQALDTYPPLHVLFTMREDYIAELTPYTNLLPEQLRPRFRMERLKRDTALQAVQKPAERAGRPFAEGVAEALVDNLLRSQPGHKLPTADFPSAELGVYVEPVHLQIVCHQLWANLPPDRTAILARDVQEFGDVDQALAGFYETVLKKVVAQTGIGERRLRNWFDTQLITPARTRGLVYRGENETEGLPNEAVNILNDAYIIRAEMRGKDAWYELAHDRLLGPVLESNQAWRDEHQSPLRLAAEAWQGSDQDPRKLYAGYQLKEAEAQAEASPEELTELEEEFIKESRRADNRQAAKRRRTTLAITVGVMIVLTLLTTWALLSAADARQQKATAVAAQDQANDEARKARQAEATAIAETTRALNAEATALSAKAAAEAQSTTAAGALATLKANLEAQLAAAKATPESPTPTLTPTPTPTPTIGPFSPPSEDTVTPTPSLTPTPSPTPTPNQAATATVGALETQVAQVGVTQTALAERDTPTATPTSTISCPAEPEGELRDTWDRHKVRLGCPIQTTPIDGFFAEQPFENGYMFWSQPPDLFVVAIGGDDGIWYLIRQSEVTWSFNPSGTSCEPDVPPEPGQFQPVRGFGGLWCARKDIREAIGFATAEERGVSGDLFQEFDHGAILRDSNRFVYVLFQDDGTYIRER